MKCFVAIFGVLVGVAMSPVAQDAPPIDSTGYENPGQIYSGATGLIPAPKTPTEGGFGAPFSAGTASPIEQQMMQGVGGFGYYDYTNALFGMDEVFNQFSRDVNSPLARQLMVYNMVLPQTAALFGQLNTFGAERYQQFTTTYPLSAMQREARDQYLQTCMMEVKLTLGAASDATTIARHNAQAAETCLQRYTARSREIQTQNEQKYSDFLRQAQDVNAMIVPLMCPPTRAASGDAASADTSKVCWPNLLLKQVRMCSDSRLDASGNPEVCDVNAFGVNPAPLPIRKLTDIMVHTVGTTYLTSITNPFLRQLAIVDGASLSNAANRATSQIASQRVVEPVSTIANFQTEFLQCVNSNPFSGLTALGQVVYEDVFGGSTDGGTPLPSGRTLAQERQRSLILTDMGLEPFQTATQQVLEGYTGLEGTQLGYARVALASAMHASVGCTINRNIPFLDPSTVIRMRNTCSPDDLQSYFKLAAMDVATVAARSMLNYTRSRLDAALARLQNDDPTALQFVSGNTPTTFDSPAVRARLAHAIRTIFIPQLEQDLKDLESTEALAQKSIIRKVTQGIYKSGSGCLSTRSGPQ